ncbi:MAG TPA: histidine kinase [Acidimicrobiales bacterium]|nr:histidine kinase [Acidimicrobiales bacterium]
MRAALAKARTDVREFKEGFQQGFKEDTSEPRTEPPRLPPGINAIGEIGVGLFMILLYGFIITSAGVPLVPWGEPAGIAAALVATIAVLLLRPARGTRLSLALVGLVFGCVVLVARQEAVSTSILLVGAAVAGMVQAAKERPVLYGVAVGGLLWGLAIQLIDLKPFGDVELILSGEPFSPDAAGRQASLLAALLLIAGMQQLMASEIRMQKERAEAAERARDEAASDERARIARELHDVVSHHVTAMTLQAEAAVATGDRKALAALATSGREASAELRRMLGVLRRPGNGDQGGPPDPQPRLTDVDALAARLSTGLEVNVQRTGEPRPLPAGVELCAYRVIQEALTNVAKHSNARHADVTVDYSPRRLTLEILDDGEPVQRQGISSGQGLIGMGERVALLDGKLEAGPREAGAGYRVFASVPL